MSGVAKKYTYPKKPALETIKIRKVNNDDYQIATISSSTKQHTPKSSTNGNNNGVWMKTFTTPDFSLLESVRNASEYHLSTDSGLTIKSVTSLNPHYDTIGIPHLVEGGDDSFVQTSLSRFSNVPFRYNDEENVTIQRIPKEPSVHSLRRTINSSGDLFIKAKPSSHSKLATLPKEQDPFQSVVPTYTQTRTGKLSLDEKRLLIITDDDGTKYFPCQKCHYAFLKKTFLVKHIYTMHRDTLVCKLCCMIFPVRNQTRYEAHIQSHSIRNKHQTEQCPYCLFWFKKLSFPKHLRIHFVRFSCTLCKYKFRKLESLQIHKERVHGISIQDQ